MKITKKNSFISSKDKADFYVELATYLHDEIEIDTENLSKEDKEIFSDIIYEQEVFIIEHSTYEEVKAWVKNWQEQGTEQESRFYRISVFLNNYNDSEDLNFPLLLKSTIPENAIPGTVIKFDSFPES